MNKNLTLKFNYSPRSEQTFGLSGILNLGWRDQLFLELTARNDSLSSLAYPKYMNGQNNYTGLSVGQSLVGVYGFFPECDSGLVLIR